jgi:hypothetical protein
MINELENILPSLKNDHQKTSLQNAIAIGVPSMKQEEWKYTYYNKILQQGFTVDTHSVAVIRTAVRIYSNKSKKNSLMNMPFQKTESCL